MLIRCSAKRQSNQFQFSWGAENRQCCKHQLRIKKNKKNCSKFLVAFCSFLPLPPFHWVWRSNWATLALWSASPIHIWSLSGDHYNHHVQIYSICVYKYDMAVQLLNLLDSFMPEWPFFTNKQILSQNLRQLHVHLLQTPAINRGHIRGKATTRGLGVWLSPSLTFGSLAATCATYERKGKSLNDS